MFFENRKGSFRFQTTETTFTRGKKLSPLISFGGGKVCFVVFTKSEKMLTKYQKAWLAGFKAEFSEDMLRYQAPRHVSLLPSKRGLPPQYRYLQNRIRFICKNFWWLRKNHLNQSIKKTKTPPIIRIKDFLPLFRSCGNFDPTMLRITRRKKIY